MYKTSVHTLVNGNI